MKLGVIMDPIDGINIKKDSTFAMMLEAQKRGYELHYMTHDQLFIMNHQAMAKTKKLKLFDDKNINKVPDDKKETIANRFNGVDEDSLNSFYKDFFIKEDNKDFFYFVAEEFVDTYFLDKQINNLTYEKHSFSLIQSITKEHLLDSFDNSDEFFKGFSGYVFRIHFKEVRSEDHTSELESHHDLVCRRLLEKKK